MFSRAERGSDIHQPMGGHLDFSELGLEVINEFIERLDLFWRGVSFFETSDETDSQCNFILGIAPEMASGILIRPARPNFDFSIAAPIAITDYEMISQPVLHVFDLPMVIIKGFGAAEFGGAAVNHDHFPTRRCDFGGINFRSDAAVEKSPVRFGCLAVKRWASARFGHRDLRDLLGIFSHALGNWLGGFQFNRWALRGERPGRGLFGRICVGNPCKLEVVFQL